MSDQDALPNVRELAESWRSQGLISDQEASALQAMEARALKADRKEDALLRLSASPAGSMERALLEAVLAKLREAARARLESAPSQESPTLWWVTGASGSGKSERARRLMQDHPSALYACGDELKEVGKKAAREIGKAMGAPESLIEPLERSAYVHRLASVPNWEMIDEAIERKVDLIVELLGLGAQEDERTLRRAMSKGYQVLAIHVGSHEESALKRAALRCFEAKRRGEEGRFVSLTGLAQKRHQSMRGFSTLRAALRSTSARFELYDNSALEMRLIWSAQGESGGDPPMERFADLESKPAGLWMRGVNPASDLAVWAQDEQGVWKIALIERQREPQAQRWGMPGGFARSGAKKGERFDRLSAESGLEAAIRCWEEKTLAKLDELGLIGECRPVSLSAPRGRDPRDSAAAWVETSVWACVASRMPTLSAGDGASLAEWVSWEGCQSRPMAFDHLELIKQSAMALGIELEGSPKAKIKSAS